MPRKIALTGIKPSGTPHIGNYLGMIRPALELQKVIFFRQSDIPEVTELTWILSCFTSKGLLNRAHAYKAAVDENEAAGRSSDEGINAGLYNYPVLMAADILLYGSHYVPVGLDQKQHIEISRDIAETFNATYGDILVIPEGVIREEVMTIPGLDGRKMSKSYDNVIPIFAPAKAMRKQVMRIVTDSRRPEEPKNPEEDNVFNIYQHFASPQQVEKIRQGYLQGGLAYSAVKQDLYQVLEDTFGEARQKYDAMMQDWNQLDRILLEGAAKARDIAKPLMEKIRKAVGVD
ncbi:MAG: tryptophan--tRNA ligase [Anaerolineales bacterium]